MLDSSFSTSWTSNRQMEKSLCEYHSAASRGTPRLAYRFDLSETRSSPACSSVSRRSGIYPSAS
ncbi:hypothetical protein VD0002_g8781 [Verticillium dahliae]|nr:hypothetical protein VD0003_g7938 [Verticillium dahliae]PNH58754.1 hypothetical protein VD0002_g8781 [Verticillium dahliae]